MSQDVSRRDFMKMLTASTGAFVLAPWGLTTLSEESAKAVLAQIGGTFPRNETLIARILTGRVGTPDNFNVWSGWRNQDRGIQNLADEPLWTVDYASGEIINGLASGDPTYNADFTSLTIPLREGVACKMAYPSPLPTWSMRLRP